MIVEYLAPTSPNFLIDTAWKTLLEANFAGQFEGIVDTLRRKQESIIQEPFVSMLYIAYIGGFRVDRNGYFPSQSDMNSDVLH